jgi:glutaredoxin
MKHLVLYTMDGCHFCKEFKTLLEKENITYINRDINEYNEEYELFRKAKNDLVPGFLIVDDVNQEKSELFGADIDFPTLEEAVRIIKERI